MKLYKNSFVILVLTNKKAQVCSQGCAGKNCLVGKGWGWDTWSGYPLTPPPVWSSMVRMGAVVRYYLVKLMGDCLVLDIISRLVILFELKSRTCRSNCDVIHLPPNPKQLITSCLHGL